MEKIMIRIKKYIRLAFICSLAIFLWGFSTWITARNYQPDAPIQTPLRSFSPKTKEIRYPADRYQSLFGGGLFFGEDVKQPVGVFQSKLVLWGLINNSLAVVGDDPASNQNTWIVKAGDTVAGEQIVSVGVRCITVRNGSGEGKVEMKN
jgi:hypothetical protein